ncbi:MNIO family bufferin maturase [Pseudomonas canadensis]|uniref:MNIO family bufferin maturase n=1 Tax=Pseudomonas canadensis TaxID=915099 RepID=UPI0030DB8140
MMTLSSLQAVSQAQAPGLPRRAGLGLKHEHFMDVLETSPDIGFFEVHAENYMVAGGPFHHYLGLIREQYPLSLHGVGLSIGGDGPLDRAHLARLAALIERYQPHSFSEHLAWSSHGPVFLNDLLPLAYDSATLQRVCEHVDQVQSTLKRPMLLENPSTYLQFQRSTQDETDFISEIIRRTGCGLLLDVNNVYVSCINHQRDPLAYIDALPLHAVGEIHLAGFAEDTDSLGDRLLIDDHGAPIDNAVWQLYEKVLAQVGSVATLIERDNQVPAFGVLLAEAQQADWHLSQVNP